MHTFRTNGTCSSVQTLHMLCSQAMHTYACTFICPHFRCTISASILCTSCACMQTLMGVTNRPKSCLAVCWKHAQLCRRLLCTCLHLSCVSLGAQKHTRICTGLNVKVRHVCAVTGFGCFWQCWQQLGLVSTFLLPWPSSMCLDFSKLLLLNVTSCAWPLVSFWTSTCHHVPNP